MRRMRRRRRQVSCGPAFPPASPLTSVAFHRYDCTAIKGAQAVSCIVGACRVDSCTHGYTPSLDGTTCIHIR